MKLSRLAKFIALTSIMMSLGVSFIALSANNATKISGTMSSVYNSKFDEADMIASKLSDIRVATMAYWTANQAWPTSLNDIITNSFYFSSFNTTTGYLISGGEGTNSYFLQLNVDNVEVGKYLANKVNGTYSAGIMTLQYALPVASIQNSVSLARYDDPADVDASTMYTDLDMGGNDILSVKSIVAAGDLTITSALGTNTLLLSETAFQMNGDDIITAGNITTYVSTDSDTLDGIDSTQFARLDQPNIFTGNLNLIDNNVLSFGDSQDLQVSHDGTNSAINNSTGRLNVLSNGGVYFQGSGGGGLGNASINLTDGLLIDTANRIAMTSDIKIQQLSGGDIDSTASDFVSIKGYGGDAGFSEVRVENNITLNSTANIAAQGTSFTFNGNEVITTANLSAQIIDANTLDGLDSTVFLRNDITAAQSVLGSLNVIGDIKVNRNLDISSTSGPFTTRGVFETTIDGRDSVATFTQLNSGTSSATNISSSVYGRSSSISNYITNSVNRIDLDTEGGSINLITDFSNSDISSLTLQADTLLFQGDKSQAFPIAMDFVNNTFKVNGFDVITAENISTYISTDADTLDGLDSTVFLRNNISAAQSVLGALNVNGNIISKNFEINTASGSYLNRASFRTDFNGNDSSAYMSQLTTAALSQNGLYASHMGKSSGILSTSDGVINNVELLTSGGSINLITDLSNSEKSDLLINADTLLFQGDKSQAFPIAMDFVNNTFKVNGFDVITAENISTYISTDADTLDGLDSTVFLRNDITTQQVLAGDLYILGQIGTVLPGNFQGVTSSIGNILFKTFNISGSYTNRIESNTFEVRSDSYINLRSKSFWLEATAGQIRIDGSRGFGIYGLTEAVRINSTNKFYFNNNEVITTNNIAAHASTDADTLDGIDSTQFARLDQVNTFIGRVSLEDGATIKGAIRLVNSSDVEYASITDADITFSGANVWATSAQLSVAGISTTGAVNAGSVTADTVTANNTLTVNSVDVGQWITNCEAGLSPGCSL
jgi:hypothetical protein